MTPISADVAQEKTGSRVDAAAAHGPMRALVGPTAWNLAGNAIPLAVGLYAIPRLIAGMGQARFGLLTLLWTLIGYFGIFDLGLGRAITQAIAEALGRDSARDVRGIVWTGFAALGGVGACAAILLSWVVRPLLLRWLKMEPQLVGEFDRALLWVSVGIPCVTIASAFRGALEGYGRFTVLNVIRIPYGALTFVVPLLLPKSLGDLGSLAVQLVVLRAATGVAQGLACVRYMRGGGARLSWSVLRRLLSFGGWLTITNVVSPLMTSVDRFVIGSLVAVSQVAYYTTPYEIVMRVLVLPGALSATLFPLLGRGLVSDREGARTIYLRTAKVLGAALFAACFSASAIGADLMGWWLGPAFAAEARLVLIVLTIGVFLNGLAYLPYTLLQSAGNSRATALTHLGEALVYIPALFGLVSKFGVTGAALAWVLRVAADLLLLEWQARRIAGGGPAAGRLWVSLATSVAAMGGASLMGPLLVRCVLSLAVCVLGAIVTIRLLFAPAGQGARRAGSSAFERARS